MLLGQITGVGLPLTRPSNGLVIATMVQGADMPSAITSIETIQRAIGDAPHLVLWNDEPDQRQTDALTSLGVRVIEAGSNRGVAGGRNVLLRAAIDLGAEWVVLLDDDLLVPRDYLRRVRRVIGRIGRVDPQLGVLAPGVLSLPGLVEERLLSTDERTWHPVLRSTRRLRRVLASEFGDDLPASVVDYMGIRGWESHYLSAHGPSASLIRGFVGASTEGVRAVNGALRSQEHHRAEILKGGNPIPVDTVPGGVSIVSTRMLRDIGFLDESMGRFGYEDAELCIRASESGYHVYMAPAMLVLHDLQGRLKQRRMSTVYSGRNRHRAVLLDRHVSPAQMGNWLFELLVLGIPEVADAVNGDSELPNINETARLYLTTVAPFVYQWHKTQATGKTGAAAEGDALEPETVPTGSLAVEHSRREGVVALRAHLIPGDGPFPRLRSASLDTSSHVADGGAVGVSWSIRVSSHNESSFGLEVELEGFGEGEDPDWRLRRLWAQWHVTIVDIEEWSEFVEETSPGGWLDELTRGFQSTGPLTGQVDIRMNPPCDLADFQIGKFAYQP